jgi:hypothetical protein
MNNDKVKARLDGYENLSYYFCNNKSKIEAVNNNLENKDFDILLLASDDMIPVVDGYDVFIKKAYYENLNNDTDYVLWLDDGFQGRNLNTLSIMGKKFYDRYGYIYHPDYKSLFADTEFTEIIHRTRRYIYLNKVLIKHMQYSIINEDPDDLYIINNKFYNYDLEIFKKRQIKNFDL